MEHVSFGCVCTRCAGAGEKIFVDDLTVFQEFERMTPLSECITKLSMCVAQVHKSDQRNRMSLYASKEHAVILHSLECHGEAFNLLGCMIDPDLRMHSTIEQLMFQIRPKIIAILRIRGYYSTSNLIFQFKTHIWGLMDTNMGGYFHAASYLLQKTDKAQNRFLCELNVIPDIAFMEYAVVPPSLRRNIGVLGFLQEQVFDKCHLSIANLLPC